MQNPVSGPGYQNAISVPLLIVYTLVQSPHLFPNCPIQCIDPLDLNVSNLNNVSRKSNLLK